MYAVVLFVIKNKTKALQRRVFNEVVLCKLWGLLEPKVPGTLGSKASIEVLIQYNTFFFSQLLKHISKKVHTSFSQNMSSF